MKVIICGGGIAGLSLAAHIRAKLKIRPIVIEQAPEWAPIGYLIGLYNNGIKTLAEFDAYNRIIANSTIIDTFHIRNYKGEIIKTLNLTNLNAKYRSVVNITRTDFHDYLLSLNRDTDFRMGTTIEKIENRTDGVRIHLSTGEVEEADLLLGCDGTNSIVRKSVFPHANLKSSGIVSFLLMSEIKQNLEKKVSQIWSEDRFFAIFPYCSSNKWHSIFACPAQEYFSQNLDALTFLRRKFSNFEWLANDILNDSTLDVADIFVDEWKYIRLNKWINNRVVLVGDAAHAMPPTIGMGANMALEDSYVLAQKLAAHPKNIDLALSSYFKNRKTRTDLVSSQSILISQLIKPKHVFTQKMRDILLRLFPAYLIEKNLDLILSNFRIN